MGGERFESGERESMYELGVRVGKESGERGCQRGSERV